MENLHRFNGHGMVLSWAVKGQGGTGHVNEQDNDYVKARICAKGYVNDLAAERALREAARFSYFKRTVMVFRRAAANGGDSGGREEGGGESGSRDEAATAGGYRATAHAPLWDGWRSSDLGCFDRVWRVDFSLHVFTNGRLSCSVLPVCTAQGDEVGEARTPAAAAAAEPVAVTGAEAGASTAVEELLTVVVTSSPIRSNPSTRLLRECLASLDRHGGLANCRKVILCDGVKVRSRSCRKQVSHGRLPVPEDLPPFCS